MTLVEMLAKACVYAQSHIDDLDAWSGNREGRRYLLQCTSYQVACFLSQNTRDGDGGVDWDIVVEELIAHPMKDEKTWQEILNLKAELYGGWITDDLTNPTGVGVTTEAGVGGERV